MNINDNNSVEIIMQNATLASAEFSQLNQEQTDKIVRAVTEAAFANRVKLAKMANEETGIGKWEDKVLKNIVSSQFVYEDIKDEKTVGIISENKLTGITEIAQPLGPILAIIPVTNPTSTTIFKILISLKTRNPIIICPSKKAVKSCAETAKICYEAAIAAGAPEGCIQWLEIVTREQTHQLMGHKQLSLILATGGGSLVNAAYSSGTPALGVGAGNVPVYIEKSADIKFSVQQIYTSKTFDYGTICASEQAIIVEKEIDSTVKSEFKNKGAKFLNDEEKAKLEAVVFDKNKNLMNADIVGKSAKYIADLAQIEADDDVALLIAELNEVGENEPLSSEILAPVLAYYVVDDFVSAVNRCIELNYFGGIGHTASIFSNNQEKIKEFSLMMNAGRIVVNTPSSQGAVGSLFNKLAVSLTLGCGTGGKNITTDNVTAKHLLNIQRIAFRRDNTKFEKFDKSLYFDENYDLNKVEFEFHKNF